MDLNNNLAIIKEQGTDKLLIDIELAFTFGLSSEIKTLIYIIEKSKKEVINKDGWIIINFDTVINDLKIDKSTMHRHLLRLKSAGLIEQSGKRSPLFRTCEDKLFNYNLIK